MSDTHPSKSVQRSDSFWPHLFDPFKEFGHTVSSFFAPSVDASNGKDVYEINIELPGVDEEDIDISVQENVISIKGEKKFEQEKKEKDYYFSERRYGSFQRSFRLPADVQTDKIDAHFEKGVLTITMPKLAELPSANQKIQIRSK